MPRFAYAILLTLYFFSLTWLFAGLPVIFNSPDESANFLFANEWRTDGDFVIEEPLNNDVWGFIHPRSMSVIGERIVPKSFLGLPALAGSVGAVLGRTAMFLVTPALAVLAVLVWESVVYAVFRDRKISVISAFLLAIHPAYWYYAGRVMMHNVGFAAFLIFSAWAASQALHRQRRPVAMFGLAGVFSGVALAFRASEIVWMVPLICTLLFWVRKQMTWKMFAAFVVGVVIALLPFAAINDALYGAPWRTGYQVVSDVGLPEAVYEIGTNEQAASTPDLAALTSIFLPFGFAERAIIRHVWQYGFALYPWMTVFVLAGITMIIHDRRVQKSRDAIWWKLLALMVALAAWLGVVYGSWVFHDNPDPSIFSLGNSYVRYWIPLFVLASPFAALGIVRAVALLPEKKTQNGALVLVCVALAILSARLVWFGDDGFVHTRAALRSFEVKRDAIVAATEDDAIVVVDRADKFLYPHRRVVVPLRREETYAVMPMLLESAPLYYFGITLPAQDFDHLNDVILAENDLRIEFMETVLDESLYKIVWRAE